MQSEILSHYFLIILQSSDLLTAMIGSLKVELESRIGSIWERIIYTGLSTKKSNLKEKIHLLMDMTSSLIVQNLQI